MNQNNHQYQQLLDVVLPHFQNLHDGLACGICLGLRGDLHMHVYGKLCTHTNKLQRFCINLHL